MAISSNSVFHFTAKLETLRLIISEGFKVKYCRESIFSTRRNRETAFYAPMVCFCDIPLSQVKNHLESYGYYGIGMTKEWAEKKGLNPVLYLEKHSMVTENILNGLLDLVGDVLISEIPKSSAKEKIADLYRYIKNFEGELRRNGKQADPTYRFSNEREWRYVPDFNECEMVIYPLWADTVDTLNNKMRQSFADFRLTFEPNDISYIIIVDDNEIDGVIDWISKEYSSKGAHEQDIKKLFTRIVTSKQIERDF